MNFTNETKAKLYGSNFSNASQQEIIEEIESWRALQVAVFWENLRELKKIFLKKEKLLNFDHFIFPAFETPQRESHKLPLIAKEAFNFWEAEEEISFLTELSLKHAIFIDNSDFSTTLFKEKVNFSQSIFKKESDFSRAIFLKPSSFKKTKFRGDSEFYHTKFSKKILFDESTFHGRVVFHKCIFRDEASFSLVSSKYRITIFSCSAKRISFKFSRMSHGYFVQNRFEYLDLHGVAIENPFFSDNRVDEAERETYGYIKHFFDDKKDYISANHYYVKEMLAYQKELFPESKSSFFKKIYHWFNKPNFGDKLVFGFSKIASEFGQNIFLPLYWILFIGSLFVGVKGEHSLLFIGFSLILLSLFILLTSIARKLFKQREREDLVWLLSHASLSSIMVGIWVYGSQFIGDFAKVINPIQIFKGSNHYCQGIELSCLLLRVFIATMVYHFIIASKRGVKR